MPDQITTKLCECGCGRPAPIAKRSNRERGHVAGQPTRFIAGHNHFVNGLSYYHWVAQQVADHVGDECLVWRFNTTEGYGCVRIPGTKKNVLVHRLAFYFYYGRWPYPFGLHRCDNPPCFNPRHIFEGGHPENCADKIAKGRAADTRGTHNGRAKLTDEIANQIRAVYARGGITQKALGQQFGVSKAAVWYVVKTKHWKQSV